MLDQVFLEEGREPQSVPLRGEAPDLLVVEIVVGVGRPAAEEAGRDGFPHHFEKVGDEVGLELPGGLADVGRPVAPGRPDGAGHRRVSEQLRRRDADGKQLRAHHRISRLACIAPADRIAERIATRSLGVTPTAFRARTTSPSVTVSSTCRSRDCSSRTSVLTSCVTTVSPLESPMKGAAFGWETFNVFFTVIVRLPWAM